MNTSPETLKIGIVGSRKRDSSQDKTLIKKTLLKLVKINPSKKAVIISGGCPKGADRFAEELAEELSIEIIVYAPDKAKKGRINTLKAFKDRNMKIAEDSDILIAAVSPERKGGTEQTIKHFEKLGKKEIILV